MNLTKSQFVNQTGFLLKNIVKKKDVDIRNECYGIVIFTEWQV